MGVYGASTTWMVFQEDLEGQETNGRIISNVHYYFFDEGFLFERVKAAIE